MKRSKRARSRQEPKPRGESDPGAVEEHVILLEDGLPLGKASPRGLRERFAVGVGCSHGTLLILKLKPDAAPKFGSLLYVGPDKARRHAVEVVKGRTSWDEVLAVTGERTREDAATFLVQHAAEPMVKKFLIIVNNADHYGPRIVLTERAHYNKSGRYSVPRSPHVPQHPLGLFGLTPRMVHKVIQELRSKGPFRSLADLSQRMPTLQRAFVLEQIRQQILREMRGETRTNVFLPPEEKHKKYRSRGAPGE